jgi:TPR repeat protein
VLRLDALFLAYSQTMRIQIILFSAMLLACSGLLGEGPWQELEQIAERSVRAGCADGDMSACDAIASRATSATTDEQFLALYDLFLFACPAGSQMSCAELGSGHVYGSRPNPDPEQTQAVLVTACRDRNGQACHLAGATLAEGRLGFVDEPGAAELLRTGCAVEHPDCCSWLGLMYEFGRGTEKDREQAFYYFKKGCELGEDQTGCFNEALRRNERGEDLETIITLFQRSCLAGNTLGCDNARVLREPGG